MTAEIIHVRPVTITGDADPGGTAERFVELTNEIIRLNRDIFTNGYRMGLHMIEVDEKRLFVFGGFNNFTDYLEHLDISRRWAYRIMQVAREYSEDDFMKIGVKKLHLVLEAPEEDRPQLLEQARNGVSRRDLEKQVRIKNVVKKAAEPEKEEPKAPPPEEKVEAKRINLVLREGLVSHKLVDRESEKASTLETLKHGSPCFTTIESENGNTLLLIVYLDKETGTLKLKASARRKEQ